MEDTLAAIWSDVDRLFEKPIKPVDTRLCLTCETDKIHTRDGLVCTGCGVIDAVYIDETAEWTSGFNDDGTTTDPARCTAPSDSNNLFSDAWGKGTIIATKFSSNHDMKRMAKINFHNSMNHKDRSLFHAYKDIDEACGNLPEVVLIDAKTMYKKFNEGKLTRGAVRTGIKANCVLYACRLAQIPRTTKEIADMFGIRSKDISRTSQMFTETINEEKTDKNVVTKPFNVMQRLLNAFEVSKDQRLQCNKLCTKLESCVELMSKSPNSVATAIIFIVMGTSISKNVLSEKCSVSVPTLNKIINIAKRHLEE